MFDFLTGFLLGIIFTFVGTAFVIYKLLLRLNDATNNNINNTNDNNNEKIDHNAIHLQYNPIQSVKHSIPKHNLDDDVNIESCTWINTIAAAICVEALSSPVLIESIHKKLHEILNKPEDKPDVLGNIVISDINMGGGLPLIDGVRVLSRGSDDSLHAEVGLLYTGGASFTISTELWMNWPTPKFAALPVSLNASFDHFAGTLTASCYWRSSTSFRVLVFFRAPPAFQLRIGSTIGHSTKLVNVLQVSSLLENTIYAFVNKELVFPNGFEIEIEEGRIVCVRKLASVRTITEKGETGAHPTGPISDMESERAASENGESPNNRTTTSENGELRHRTTTAQNGDIRRASHIGDIRSRPLAQNVDLRRASHSGVVREQQQLPSQNGKPFAAASSST